MTEKNGNTTPVKEHVHEITIVPEILSLLWSIQKYQEKDKIALFGEASLNKSEFIARFLRTNAQATYDALKKRVTEKAQQERDSFFRLLVSRGMALAEAYKMAYGVPAQGTEQVKPVNINTVPAAH